MMRVVFAADEFRLRAPLQQLLDRFLMGYPVDGRFHRPDCEVILVAPESNGEIERRTKNFGLKWQAEAASGDGSIMFSAHSKVKPTERCFVYGAPLSSVTGLSGTAIRGAWLLPEIKVQDVRPVKVLVVVQGTYPRAEIEALDVLMPMTWRSSRDVRNVVPLTGNNFWQVLRHDFWPLFKSAISRSDSPQGDPVRDGRTQDIVGLGLVETLAKSPRGWLIEHEHGPDCIIAVLDGAVSDYNVALQTRAGGILSAQVHRGVPPAEHHYSRLAAMIENYFRTGIPPWPLAQTAYVAELLQRFDGAYGERRR